MVSYRTLSLHDSRFLSLSIYIFYDFWGLVVFRKCVFPPYLPPLPGLFYNCVVYKLSSPGATAEINLKLTFFRTAKINC